MKNDINATPSRGQLRQEAADWFAIMRGPDAEAWREDFNGWLAESPSHRRAYNSIAETFNLTKSLKSQIPHSQGQEKAIRDGDSPTAPSRLRTMVLTTMAAILAISLGCFAWQAPHDVNVPPANQSARADLEARYTTSIGEIRNFVLIDGSKLTLDTNSIVLASYTGSERGLRLLKGRARFFVSKEARPFVVRADTTVVTAHGTIFDVTLVRDRRVDVHLLQGLVAVQSQAEPALSSEGGGKPATPIITQLAAGQRITIDAAQLVMPRQWVQGDESWPNGVEAFNDIPLTELIAAANRYTQKPVLLSDPQVGAMRISGTFHLTDTGAVAQKVAALLDLSVFDDRKIYRLDRARQTSQ